MVSRSPLASIDAHPIDPHTGLVDEAKLEVLLVEVRRLARRLAGRFLDPHDAEDLAQDVVVACLASIRNGTWDGRGAALPAMIAQLVNCRAVDRQRRLHSRRTRQWEFGREIREVDRSWMSPDVSMDERDLEQLREQALGVLSPHWRRAYELVCEDGLSHKEAAVILGVSRTRVSTLVAKTRERLCMQLNDRGVELPGWCRLEEFPMRW